MSVRVCLAALIVLLTGSGACGGRTIEGPSTGTESPTSSSDDGGDPAQSTGSDTSSGSSGGTAFPICPKDAPNAGWSCDTPSQGCAYWDPNTGACVSFVCSSGHWVSATPAGC